MSTAGDILQAFITHSANGKSHVTFAARSPPEVYVRVYGPSADPNKTSQCHVIVGANGSIAVSEELKPHLQVAERPDGVRVADDPAGFGSGPNYGRFRWTITGHYATPYDLVVDVVRAVGKASIAW